ncbi:MAG: two-component regulator propeller domain-containing protein [Acidobacteriota bacterium]
MRWLVFASGIWLAPLAPAPLLPQAIGEPGPARPMRFEQLSIEDGLSQSVVNCIVQDSAGFLWLGTQDGLNRYDGYEFVVYRHDPRDETSLGHDWIMAIAEDSSGDLWIGTEGGGLSRWHRASDTFSRYRHDPDDPQSLSDDRIIDLNLDRAGTLWVGTLGAGLNRFDRATSTFERFRHDPADSSSLAHDRVGVIHEDRAGRLWVGTWGGLDLFDRERRVFRHHRHDPHDATSLTDDRVRTILEEQNGSLWIGTRAGLNRVMLATEKASPATGIALRFERHLADSRRSGRLSDDWVRALLQDQAGRLWVGTDGGLNLWHETEERFTSYHPRPVDRDSLHSDHIVQLYQDWSGILWIGTVGGGLHKWNPADWALEHYRSISDDGASRSIFAVTEDPRGGLWLGTFGGGVERVDRGTGVRRRLTHDPADPSSLSDDRVTALLSDRQGGLWIGTVAGGLNHYDPVSDRFVHHRHDPTRGDSLAANGVTALHQDGEGRLWVGTYGGGLDRYEGEGSFRHFAYPPADSTCLGGNRVFGIAEDASGYLWLATDGGGLDRLDPTTGTLLHLHHDPDAADSLAGNEVISVHVDPSGQLWVGTKGRGLDRLLSLDETTGSARFANISLADGLPDGTISGLRSDLDGRLWLSTNRGLVRLDPASGELLSFDTDHGLQSNEFNLGAHYRNAEGELFFGGVNGLNVFRPEQLQLNRHRPSLVVTAVSKINQPSSLGKPAFALAELELAHTDYFFSVEMAALDFTAPQENRYRYRLEGFDEDWVDLGPRRRVTFTNLDAGHYTLRLQGANNDGLWNEDGTAIRISVAPPPWRSVWAYGLYILALVTALELLVRLHQRKIDRERAIAERERGLATERQRLLTEREALIEELEAKNAELERFNYTVSHDLKSPLVTIKGFLELLRKDASVGDLERVRHDVRRITSAADRMRNLLDELLELSKVGRDIKPMEEVPLTAVAREALDLIGGPAQGRVEVVLDPELPIVFGDRIRLRQLYQNLLANAVKYMGDQSTPRVEVGWRQETAKQEASRPERARPQALGAASISTPAETVFFVRDNGVGIDDEHQEKVFGLFERLDPIGSNDGTGIGLALAKRIVEMHGGSIWVESQGAGRGSAFCFTLPDPLAPDPADTSVPSGRVVEASGRFRRSAGK